MNILIVDDEEIALMEAEEAVRRTKPSAEVICAGNYIQALEAAKESVIDVAVLDIDMPGMSGLGLAKSLKECNPDTNIIFLTAFDNYALDAFSLFASGYLLTPVNEKELERAFENLIHPVKEERNRFRVQCFGNFEVFCEGKPVHFSRSKSREFFAYLIYLNGATANIRELCGILFDNSQYGEKERHYIRILVADIRKTLKECQCEDVFITRRNQYSIDPSRIDCDYYRFLKRDVRAVNSYRGEYMKQYSWAVFSRKSLDY